jgi:hypothetical protein
VVTLANWRLLGSVMFDLLDRLVKTQLDQAELPQSLVEQFPYSVWSIDELEVALQIMQSVGIMSFIAAEPDNWWMVEDVVDLYIRFRSEAKRKRAEAAILAPLGLDSHSFLANQNSMNSQIVEAISRDLISFEVPSVALIVAGIARDNHGIHPHIYSIYDGEIRCDDVVGFSSVGSGSRHAETIFMLAGHGWNSELPETLMLSYSAKKNLRALPVLAEKQICS